jgi:hypothetical protein
MAKGCEENVVEIDKRAKIKEQRLICIFKISELKKTN